MLNPDNISFITRRTLRRMGIVEPALEKLIKGTFLMQSNLEYLYDDTQQYNRLRGLMLMSDSDARETIGEYIRYRPEDRKKVSEATGVDLFNLDLEETLILLETNISFMVAVTVMFYSNNYVSVPKNSLESIAVIYKSYFNENVSVDEFVAKYTETFVGR